MRGYNDLMRQKYENVNVFIYLEDSNTCKILIVYMVKL